MLPFQFTFQSGTPVHEQAAFAARRAIVSGKFQPGDPFPSVRVLSRELKIHANTAQKEIAQLQQEGLLEVRPGIGTVVAQPPLPHRSESARLLRPAVEELAVEAKRLGVSIEDLRAMVSEEWRKLSQQEEARK